MSRGLAPVAILLAACSTTSTDPWPADEAPLAETVGWLDEKPVTYGAVARYTRTQDPEGFRRNLMGLALERATLAEAKPLGVTVAKGLVMRATEQRMEAWEKHVRERSKKETGTEIDPALFLQAQAAISLAELRFWVRQHIEIELIQDRLARYEMLTSPHVEVSLIVVKKKARARRFAGEIERGGSFAGLAKKHSVHTTAKSGGRIDHPLVQADVGDPKVRKAIFNAEAGTVLGPYPVEAGDATLYELYRVEASHAPLRGGYAQLRREVERSLEARPLTVAEYSRWNRRIRLRHPLVAARVLEEPR